MSIFKQSGLFLTLLLSMNTAWAGPFGLEMGDKLIDIDSNAKIINPPNVYITKKVPNPHPDFSQYILRFNKEGLYSVTGIGKPIKSAHDGSELLCEFVKVVNALDGKYGDSRIIGKRGRFSMIYLHDTQFMRSLLQGKSRRLAVWSESKILDNNSLNQISLKLFAENMGLGHVEITYSFVNSHELIDLSKVCDEDYDLRGL